MNARSFGFLALLALAPLAVSQDFNQKITFSGPAMPAKKVLVEISKQANYPFETSVQTASTVLLIKVKDVALGDLLKKIAEAAGAEWSKEEKGYRLIRSASLQQSQAQADNAARAKQIQEALTKLTESVDQKPEYTRSDADQVFKERSTGAAGANGARIFGGQNENNPTGRALLRLLKMIPATNLAAMPPSSRTVYSTYPTRMQVGLRGNVQAVLNQFIKEQNVFAEASAGAATGSQPPVFTGPDGSNFRVVLPTESSAKPVEGRLGKTLLVVSRLSSDAAFNLELKIYDDKGKLTSRATKFVMPAADPGIGSTSTDKAITLSEESKQFAKMLTTQPPGGQRSGQFMIALRAGESNLSVGGGNAEAPEVNAEWREKLTRPDEYEPLSYVLPDLYGAIAESKGANLVAGFHDTLLMPVIRRISSGTMTVSQLLAISKSQLDLNITHADGWVVVSPKYPTEAYASRIDRVALGNLLRKAQGTGYARLIDLATYATKQPNYLGSFALDERYMAVLGVDSGAGFAPGNADRRAMLRLYASLSNAQRQSMSGNDYGLALGLLSPQQKAIVHGIVYDSMMGPNINLPPDPTQSQLREERVRQTVQVAGGGPMMMSFRSDEELMHERTEALPNGVPGDGNVHLAVNTDEAVLASRAQGPGSQLFTAGDYGGYQAMRLSPNMAQFTSGQPEYDRFRSGTIIDHFYNFTFSQTATMNRSLRDVQLSTATTPMTYNQLPQSFRERAEASKERAGNALKGMNFTPGVMPGRQGAPPPR